MRAERQFGREYSDAYDSLYREKDYLQESRFLIETMLKYSKLKVKDVLSLGCGTCTPDILLAKAGFSVHGIDLSPAMLGVARKKIVEARKEGLSGSIRVQQGDMTRLSLEENYDFAMAMFNVAGYWRTNEDFDRVLKGVNGALRSGGLFVFDGWYEPAVLKDRPGDRAKIVEDGDRRIIRITNSELDVSKSIIDINFHTFVLKGKKLIAETKENHPARYWHLQEIAYFLENNGFELVNCSVPLDLETPPSEDNWNLFIVAQKK